MSLHLANLCIKNRGPARYLGVETEKRMKASSKCLSLSPFFEWNKQEFNDETCSWRFDETTITRAGVQSTRRQDRQMPKRIARAQVGCFSVCLYVRFLVHCRQGLALEEKKKQKTKKRTKRLPEDVSHGEDNEA